MITLLSRLPVLPAGLAGEFTLASAPFRPFAARPDPDESAWGPSGGALPPSNERMVQSRHGMYLDAMFGSGTDEKFRAIALLRDAYGIAPRLEVGGSHPQDGRLVLFTPSAVMGAVRGVDEAQMAEWLEALERRVLETFGDAGNVEDLRSCVGGFCRMYLDVLGRRRPSAEMEGETEPAPAAPVVPGTRTAAGTVIMDPSPLTAPRTGPRGTEFLGAGVPGVGPRSTDVLPDPAEIGRVASLGLRATEPAPLHLITVPRSGYRSVKILLPGGRPFKILTDTPLPVGRADLDGAPSVEETHFTLQCTCDGWRVYPQAPTYIAGILVPREGAALPPGATLRVGSVLLTAVIDEDLSLELRRETSPWVLARGRGLSMLPYREFPKPAEPQAPRPETALVTVPSRGGGVWSTLYSLGVALVRLIRKKLPF